MLLSGLLTIIAAAGAVISLLLAFVVQSHAHDDIVAIAKLCQGATIPLLAITVVLWLTANDPIAAKREREARLLERSVPRQPHGETS